VLDIVGQAAPHDTQVWLPLGGKLVPRALGRRLPPALRPRLGAVVLHKPDVQCAQVGLALLTCTGQPIHPTERGPCLQQPGRRALRPAPRAAEATADRVRDAGQDGPRQEVQAGFPLRRGPPEVAASTRGTTRSEGNHGSILGSRAGAISAATPWSAASSGAMAWGADSACIAIPRLGHVGGASLYRQSAGSGVLWISTKQRLCQGDGARSPLDMRSGKARREACRRAEEVSF